MADPKIAIDTVLETEKNITDEIKIEKLTLGRYALLDLVDSPFINNKIEFTAINLLPTFFIMTQPKEVIKNYNSKNIEELIAKSIEWADDFSPDIISKMIDAVAEKFGLVKKVSPTVSNTTTENGVVTTKK